MQGRGIRILVTGASGFVGKRLIRNLNYSSGISEIIALSRKPCEFDDLDNVSVFQITDILAIDEYESLLGNVDVVIHLAARVHVLNETAKNPLSEFLRVNVEGTVNLATAASSAGVKRLIYLSSIKVNGESTRLDEAFSFRSVPQPIGPYAISKYRAEVGLRLVERQTGMDIVILRPPLVYGGGVSGNFEKLARLLLLRIPLPLGGVTRNRRSYVYVENLVDLITTCVSSKSAKNKTFLVADDQILSSAELIRIMASSINFKYSLYCVPEILFKFVFAITFKKDIYQRICGSLEVDDSYTRDTLGWSPKFSAVEGITRSMREMAGDE